jgi:3-isopropylmalate/(R)-2-methylmalate dehydratase small subunit
MIPFTLITSHIVAIPTNNIDTDQIIPARFLKSISKSGLSQNLFSDWRYKADGQLNPEFALNQPEAQDAQILLVGDNFGCGSSREHSIWALMDFGFRAIISTSFSDIFRNNSLMNGLLPVEIDAETHHQLLYLVEESPSMQVVIDLEVQTLTLPIGWAISFPIDGFSKACLLEGLDLLGYLFKHSQNITAYEQTHPPQVNTRVSHFT